MINSITGIITGAYNRYLYVDVQGLEYQIIVSSASIQRYQKNIESKKRIITYLHVTDRSLELYGFYSMAERTLFLSLLKVDGISAKAAIKILSHTSPEDFLDALHAYDNKTLANLPGIGLKTANKILVALENVFIPSKRNVQIEEVLEGSHKAQFDILMALVAMGYEKELAKNVLENIIKEHSYDTNEKILENEGKLLQQVILRLV